MAQPRGGRFALSGADPQFSTQWLPDTSSYHHKTVVWLRLLQDEYGKPFFTLQELAVLVDSANRLAAIPQVEDFRQYQQGVTQWLEQHFTTAEAINRRKRVMKHAFQTQDKRTVRRRLAQLKAQAAS